MGVALLPERRVGGRLAPLCRWRSIGGLPCAPGSAHCAPGASRRRAHTGHTGGACGGLLPGRRRTPSVVCLTPFFWTPRQPRTLPHVGSTEGVRWKGYPSKELHAAALRVAKTP